MGAEPGRRFLKQPAAKLEPVIVATTAYYCDCEFRLGQFRSVSAEPLAATRGTLRFRLKKTGLHNIQSSSNGKNNIITPEVATNPLSLQNCN